jgi:hypothetical protein
MSPVSNLGRDSPEVFVWALLHCVRTATLVAPLVTPPPSLNRTNTRWFAGSNETAVPVPETKIAKVGV